jgi:hypothetical protein
MTSSSGSNTFSSPSDRAWAVVELEQRRDRAIRRIAIVCWAVVFGFALLYAGAYASFVIQSILEAPPENRSWGGLLFSILPALGMFMGVASTAAVIATVGVFLRFRSASMAEIQFRLASLEQLLTTRADA